jgi:hypothetical protein
MSRFMTKRQGGVLLPATTFVVLQTRQSNVKSAGAGVALTYRAHAGLFLRWGRGRTLGFRCASAGRRREEHEQNGPDRRSGSLGRPGFLPIMPVYRKLGTGQGKFGLDHGVGHFRPLSITRHRHLLTYHGTAMSHEGLCQVF